MWIQNRMHISLLRNYAPLIQLKNSVTLFNYILWKKLA